MSDYQHPSRGELSAYDRYLQGMDASMKQKVALTAAHLLAEGRIADMGMGSGNGSHALAALYPHLQVVGVDVDPNMVGLAQQKYVLPNLQFIVGDVASRVFEPETMDGIFDSSVLHHVTSFGGYERERAAAALSEQVKQLKPGGALIVRDFLDPGAGEVLLEVPHDDGSGDDPRSCSTAALLERFAREFRSLSPRPGFELKPLGASSREGWSRYRLPHTLAVEFLLRKDYRTDWEAEVKEEYTYLTQSEFEEVFSRLGLRVLASTPLRNPWIVRHRFDGKFLLSALDGTPLETPATNFLIVGEKVLPEQGVRFVNAAPAAPLGFLELTYFRNRQTGRVMDLVRRPNTTVDVLPHFQENGVDYVLVRATYPRPILTAASWLDGSTPPGYVTEPLNVLQADHPIGTTVENALRELAGFQPSQLLGFRMGPSYYPSPGGVQEEVRSVLVEVEPGFRPRGGQNRSGFSEAGSMRAVEARQLLRAAQVGGLPDARLELNVYELLLSRGADVGPWIGDTLDLADSPLAPTQTDLAELFARKPRRLFEPARPDESTRFLELRCARFAELAADGREVAAAALEYVAPSSLSLQSVATALLWRRGDEVWLGVDDDDLPAAQSFRGNSQLLVTPAWRLPKSIPSLTPARAWLRERLKAEYGLEAGALWSLGGSYAPSAGVTPEIVWPMAVEVRSVKAPPRSLSWVRIDSLVRARAELLDGHLRIAVLRAAHALGRLSAVGGGSRGDPNSGTP